MVLAYAHGHKGVRTVASSAALRTEAAADASRELRGLLKLLHNLTQREFVDFSEEDGRLEEQQPPDIAQVFLSFCFGGVGATSVSIDALRRIILWIRLWAFLYPGEIH